ncbi:caveolin-1-like [Centruroides vittatus]|uniref:caveolin-1-like n=1 Tax=Centruroides vittatus TaxID=120091 RepID=UPI00350ECEE8
MEDIKEKRSESKTKLNESTLPLLEDSECIEGKEKDIELKSVEKEEPKDKSEDETGQVDGKEMDGEKKIRKEKSHKRSISCAETMTAGLNLLDRDEKRVNDHVNLVFEDVLAESDAAHSFNGSWKSSYIVFTGTKHWVYRVLTALISIPFALVWGLIFSILTLIHVWLITPMLQVLELVFFPLRKVWSVIIRGVLDPLFQSVGLMFGAFQRNNPVEA